MLSALSDHTQSRHVCALTHAPGPCPKVKNPLPNSHRRRGESNTLCSNVSFQLLMSTSPVTCYDELDLGKNRNKILSGGVVGLSVSQN